MWARLLLVQRSVDVLYIRHIEMSVCVCGLHQTGNLQEMKRGECACVVLFFPLSSCSSRILCMYQRWGHIIIIGQLSHAGPDSRSRGMPTHYKIVWNVWQL